MNFFRNVVPIFVGVVWALFRVFVLASITNHPVYSSETDMRRLQIICFFVMSIGAVPFGFGLARLVR